MDSARDSGMNGATEPAPAPDRAAELAELGAELVAAVNEQVLPQLAHLAHGPLAVGSLQALHATLERGEPVTAVVMQVRVMVRGRLYTLAVQAVASP